MSRWKASALHLIISFLVVGSIAGLIYFLWFPYHLIRIAGMDRLLLTMLGVDIVAGPLLILFKLRPEGVDADGKDKPAVPAGA